MGHARGRVMALLGWLAAGGSLIGGGRVGLAAPVTVRVAETCAEPGAADVPVAVSVANDVAVRALSFTVRDTPDQVALVTGSTPSSCTERTPATDGWSCAANEVPGTGIQAVVVSLMGAVIDPGSGAVMVLHLRDGAPLCSPGTRVTLDLANVLAADANSQPLAAIVESGGITCGCPPLTTTTTTTTRTTTSTTTATTTTTVPVPATSTTSTLPAGTTTTTLAACVAGGPAACEDGDHCTDDICDPRGGCMNVLKSAGEAPGVTCRVDNMRDIIREAPQPVCPRRCPDSIEGGLSKTAQLIDGGATAPTKGKCTRKLQAARRVADALQRRIAQLVKRGRIVPGERAQPLSTESKKLAEGTRDLATSGFCARR